MMATHAAIDWTRLALLARVASAAYVRDTLEAEKAFDVLGMQFVTILGNGQCYVTVARWDGRIVLAIRGTQVVSGFSLAQLLDNERVGYADTLVGPLRRGAAMDGYYTPLANLYRKLEQFIDGPPIVTGHSMGGVRALLMAALLPNDIDLEITAFAPPKGATKELWESSFAGRSAPLLVGRANDFAPNHPIAASVIHGYCQPDAILDIGEAPPRFLAEWPVLDESIADHDVDKYVADCAALAANPPATTPEAAA